MATNSMPVTDQQGGAPPQGAGAAPPPPPPDGGGQQGPPSQGPANQIQQLLGKWSQAAQEIAQAYPQIAAELNKEGISAPSGGDWGFSTINGNAAAIGSFLRKRRTKRSSTRSASCWPRKKPERFRPNGPATNQNVCKNRGRLSWRPFLFQISHRD